jgi:hypothetical protein
LFFIFSSVSVGIGSEPTRAYTYDLLFRLDVFSEFLNSFGHFRLIEPEIAGRSRRGHTNENAKAAREELNFRTILFSFFIFLPPFLDNALQSDRLTWLAETDCTGAS